MPSGIGLFLVVILMYAYCWTLYEYLTAMVEWLRCSTRVYNILCSNLGCIIHGMTLDK